MTATVSMPAAYSVIKIDTETGMQFLRDMFPEALANPLNFVMFSTSGVHGSYTTIEAIEETLRDPDKFEAAHLTVLVVHPRTVCMHYGNIRVERADIPFLKALRASSGAVMLEWAVP